MIAHLIAAAIVIGTPVATHEAIDAVVYRVRLARHLRRTRRAGRMLQRPTPEVTR